MNTDGHITELHIVKRTQIVYRRSSLPVQWGRHQTENYFTLKFDVKGFDETRFPV